MMVEHQDRIGTVEQLGNAFLHAGHLLLRAIYDHRRIPRLQRQRILNALRGLQIQKRIG